MKATEQQFPVFQSMNDPEGWGVQTKNPPWGEYGYFLEQDITIS